MDRCASLISPEGCPCIRRSKPGATLRRRVLRAPQPTGGPSRQTGAVETPATRDSNMLGWHRSARTRPDRLRPKSKHRVSLKTLTNLRKRSFTDDDPEDHDLDSNGW